MDLQLHLTKNMETETSQEVQFTAPNCNCQVIRNMYIPSFGSTWTKKSLNTFVVWDLEICLGFSLLLTLVLALLGPSIGFAEYMFHTNCYLKDWINVLIGLWKYVLQ